MLRRRIQITTLFFACSFLSAAEAVKGFPLWNGVESTADYARRVNLPATQRLDMGKGAELELVLVPAGRFVMGTPEAIAPRIPLYCWKIALGISGGLGLLLMAAFALRGRAMLRFPFSAGALGALYVALLAGAQCHAIRAEWKNYGRVSEFFKHATDDLPAHVVVISAPFYMSRCEITQEQYEAALGANPSKARGARLPVDSVTWNDAAAFCQKAAKLAGRQMQLPSEAQWEYACRAGTSTLFNTGDTIGFDQANIDGNETTDVGRFKPNAFGLHDMHGNVWEWCSDYYAEEYYKESPARDPLGPAKSPHGNARAMRGGSCRGDPDFYRSASRRWLSADDSDEDVGFRVIVAVDAQ